MAVAASATAAAVAAAVSAPLLGWCIRDQLLLADLVLKYGTQNWVRAAGGLQGRWLKSTKSSYRFLRQNRT